MPDGPIVAIAGVAGDLGGRIARALVARGAQVRALVRRDADAGEVTKIKDWVSAIATADPHDVDDMASACAGAACVVSALNGVREVMIGRQGVLIDAAVKAGVPRFIPSDYSADFTKTRPGDNRNFDLRREFMALADSTPIQVTSILNGAFMDMLGRDMPIIQPRIRRVLYWHDVDQLLDFTTKDNVAAFVAAAAMDHTTPRILRIADDVVSARDIAAIMTTVTGKSYTTLCAGSIGILGAMIRIAKMLAPQTNAAFPPWQGMQYMRDQFSGAGKLRPLDNRRYDLAWTSVLEMMQLRPAVEPAR